MKNLFRRGILIILFFPLVCWIQPPDSCAQATPFTILHFNDSHSNLTGSGPKSTSGEYSGGGFDRIASIIKSSRSTDTNVLVFHIGDFSTGSFVYNRYFGVPELTLFKRLGFDAITLGNHEFDLGPQVLLSSLSQSFIPGSIPVLSANLITSGFPALESYVTKYTIKTVNGIKVGLFGLTINDPSSNPSPVIISDSILQTAQNMVSILQSNGCGIIICLSHMGYNYDIQIAATIPGINIILGGHDHNPISQPVPVPNPAGFNTLVCQAGSYYKYAGKMKFSYNSGSISMNSYQLIDVNESVPRDDSVRLYLDSLKAGIVQKYGNVFTGTVCFALKDIIPSYNQLSAERDTPLGNLVTDAYRNYSGTQISLTAVGLMSQPLYRGSVKGEDILRAAPYGYDTATGLNFRLVKFMISGSELKRGLELVLYASMTDESYHPQSSGLTFDYNSSQPLGYKILLPTMKINDTLLNPFNLYSVTANEGLFRALSLLGITVSNVDYTGVNEYTAIRDYAQFLRKVNYSAEGRIKDVYTTGTGNNGAVASEYKLFQNYPNPFNPLTTIMFEIQKPSVVSLKIYDITGREIEALINKEIQPGTHRIKWNGLKYASGAYFYRLSVNGKHAGAKKMILIK